MGNVTSEIDCDFAGRQRPARIVLPYLMVVEQLLPIYRDKKGRLFAGDLWQKDLSEHLEYIDHLMLASPCHQQEPPPDAKPLVADHSTLELIELPAQRSLLQSLRVMPTIVLRLSRAVRRAGIVHSAIVGFPIPMGWIVTPLAMLFRKPLVIIVESAPWRLQQGITFGWKRRLRSILQEYMGRWVLRNAKLVICTQDEYRQSLLGARESHGHIIPASWIDEKDILSHDEVNKIWDKKLSAPGPRLRILFVGRLLPEKGVLLLLEAMRRLSVESAPITLDILGEGDLKAKCEAAAAELTGTTAVNLLGTVPYGPPLFAVIRQYDAVVIPSISDEQPRIVFDAYSQGVPVLASDTAGLRSCVRNGEVGLLAPPNDISALCSLLRDAVLHRQDLKKLGLQSLNYAHSMTHQEMHRRRAVLLQEMLDTRK